MEPKRWKDECWLPICLMVRRHAAKKKDFSNTIHVRIFDAAEKFRGNLELKNSPLSFQSWITHVMKFRRCRQGYCIQANSSRGWSTRRRYETAGISERITAFGAEIERADVEIAFKSHYAALGAMQLQEDRGSLITRLISAAHRNNNWLHLDLINFSRLTGKCQRLPHQKFIGFITGFNYLYSTLKCQREYTLHFQYIFEVFLHGRHITSNY